MNIKKIIREEINNLPSFGINTCMIVHKSGNVFMSNNDVDLKFKTYEELEKDFSRKWASNLVVSNYCLDCDEQEERLKWFIEKTEAYEEHGPGERFIPKHRNTSIGVPYAITMQKPYEYDPREFEVVEYYQGLIPKTSDIY